MQSEHGTWLNIEPSTMVEGLWVRAVSKADAVVVVAPGRVGEQIENDRCIEMGDRRYDPDRVEAHYGGAQ